MSWKDYKSVSAAQKAGSMYFAGKDGEKKLAVTKEQLDSWKSRNKGKFKGSALTAWANAKGRDLKGDKPPSAPRARPSSTERQERGQGPSTRGRRASAEVDAATRSAARGSEKNEKYMPTTRVSKPSVSSGSSESARTPVESSRPERVSRPERPPRTDYREFAPTVRTPERVNISKLNRLVNDATIAFRDNPSDENMQRLQTLADELIRRKQAGESASIAQRILDTITPLLKSGKTTGSRSRPETRMAKGGMVKANCGASMKPNRKAKK